MGYSGAGVKLIHKKTRSKKSRDTVPLRKTFGPIFKELENFLLKKLSLCSHKYGFGIRDPRSGIMKKPFPDPGSRGQNAPDPGSGSATLVETFTTYNQILIFEEQLCMSNMDFNI
jgi:hypothetical protein